MNKQANKNTKIMSFIIHTMRSRFFTQKVYASTMKQFCFVIFHLLDKTQRTDMKKEKVYTIKKCALLRLTSPSNSIIYIYYNDAEEI